MQNSARKVIFVSQWSLPKKRQKELLTSLNAEKAEITERTSISRKGRQSKECWNEVETVRRCRMVGRPKDNFYFCPMAFCYTCNTVLMPSEVDVHREQEGHQEIYLVPPSKLG